MPVPTYFRHQPLSYHMVLIHSLHVSKSSQYSLIHSTLQLLSLLSLLDPFVTLAPHFSNNSFREHSLSFSQHSSYPAVCTIQRHWDNYSFILSLLRIYPQTFIAQHTFQHSTWFKPLIHSAYQIPFTSSIRCHLQPRGLKQFTVYNLSPFNLSYIIFTNLYISITWKLHYYLHSLATFLIIILWQTLSPVYTASPRCQPLLLIICEWQLVYLKPAPIHTQQFQHFTEHPSIPY